MSGKKIPDPPHASAWAFAAWMSGAEAPTDSIDEEWLATLPKCEVSLMPPGDEDDMLIIQYGHYLGWRDRAQFKKAENRKRPRRG